MQTMDTPLREEIKGGINLKPLFKHMQTPLRKQIEKGLKLKVAMPSMGTFLGERK